MTRALDRKLLRDLWRLRAQGVAIALVIAGGVATYLMAASTLDSLQRTEGRFYREYRFGEVFASLKRAPESVAAQIRAIPGTARVETRVLGQARLQLPGFPDPVTAVVVSIPDRGQPALNRLYLRSGRLPRPDAGRAEALVSEAFAEAHRLRPGDVLRAVINGRSERLRICGIALSPEFIYQMRPGDMFPDYRRYGVLWMARTPLANVYGMDGAFNDVVLGLAPRADAAPVIKRLDSVLALYGGLGAYDREDQFSHHYLSQELQQLRTIATLLPGIFLAVAAFLLNIVMSRLIRTQRGQIGVLKAFGYGPRAIALHYVMLASVIALAGIGLGIAAGAWLGHVVSDIYRGFFRFPFLDYRLAPGVVGEAVAITGMAALAGTLFAVRRASRLPPAAAMQPEPPPVYRRTLLERLGLQRLFDQPTRMVVRHLEREPVKSLLSVTGIAFAVAIMMVGRFQTDVLTHITEVQFKRIQNQDLTVTFRDPASRRALYELRGLPGVRWAEPFRVVSVRFRHGPYTYRGGIQAYAPGSRLHHLLDADLRPVTLPPDGLLMTDYLAEMLHTRPGQEVAVEVLEGRRRVLRLPLVGVVGEHLGVSGYMRLSALNRALGDGDVASGALVAGGPGERAALYRRLREMPAVAGVTLREAAIESFHATMGETLLIFTFITTLLAAVIAFGVVYNSARITLVERTRELASLRILGFARAEAAYILVGELALITLTALVPGFLVGRALCFLLSHGMRSELYRVPLVIAPRTYAFAAIVVMAAMALSALLVWRRVARLDLVRALKTRE
ncbi:MAG TPA: ABC transporter permease [Gammaproteobacteria bacterium]|nr:ABC transporter permease [Gammaproteobacteria bacterium]